MEIHPKALAHLCYSISAIRSIKTESLTFKDAQSILNKQRLHRPSSPHFTIYKPQIPWILSIVTRFTGAGLSVGMLC
jgi:succinate dehydrogenase (ubiquinone) cytochrome b560 subunit